jgi:hypothetical protein
MTSRFLKMFLVMAALSSCGPKPKPYPLDNCVISGNKLGAHGEPYEFVRDGQEVKLCCKNCKPDFEKEPAKFMAKLAAK